MFVSSIQENSKRKKRKEKERYNTMTQNMSIHIIHSSPDIRFFRTDLQEQSFLLEALKN